MIFPRLLVALSLFSGLVTIGYSADKSEPFTRLVFSDGHWFFADAKGRQFLSKGIDQVTMDHCTIRDTEKSPYRDAALAKYGTVEKWREAQAQRLFSWGFNTLGTWSDPALSKVEVNGQKLYHTITVDFSEAYLVSKGRGDTGAWLHGVFPDVFDPAFPSICTETANKICRPFAEDPQVLGFFTDNELRWGPDWRGKKELLTEFLNFPAEQSGRVAALVFLQERYPAYADFQAVWPNAAKSWKELAALENIEAPYERKELYFQNQAIEREANSRDPRRATYLADCEAFLAVLAEKYFQVTTSAVRSAAPRHLVFGSRFAYVPAQAVVAACARYVDAISYNSYDADPEVSLHRYEAFQLPLMIGEFSFRARDSGLPNTKGAGPIVDTQRERAEGYTKFVSTVLRSPYLVSYHWFNFADEPKEGRFDGEDSNYGAVTITDDVYPALTKAMTETNHQAEAWARSHTE